MSLFRRSARRHCFFEILELRTLLSAAFDVTHLTDLRNDSTFNTVDGSDLSVAILDTGLFASHPDIQGNFLRYFDAVKNGRNAETDPGTAVASQATDPPGEGHGTHVAGTVGSTNPAIGVATGTNLISVRVLPAQGEAQPSLNPLVAGLRWVVAHQDDYNIRVVNMSLGTNTNFNAIPNKDDVAGLIDQLEGLGVTVVSAAGNSYGGFASLGEAYPAIFSTIAVANTWEDSGTTQERQQITLGQSNTSLFGVIDQDPNADQLSASSQRSTVDNLVAAPGTTIFSTWNGDNGLLYNTIAGTSMASPFVAGSVALMQDAAFTFGGRYLTPTEVLAIIKETADNITDSQDPGTERFPVGQDSSGQLVQTGPVVDLPESGLTFKRINVYNAVKRVRDFITNGTAPTPTPTDPGDRTGDTNNTLQAATTIPSLTGLAEYDFTGNVGADGDVNVGADDVDLYKIVLDSPGFPVFDLSTVSGGTSFDPVVRLFDQAGNQLASLDNSGNDPYPTLDTATALSSPLAAGTYFLGVSAAGNSAYNPTDASGVATGGSIGDYTVTIGLSNPDPNGVVQGAAPIDLTDPNVIKNATNTPANFAQGTIGSDPNPLTADGTPRIQTGAEDVDFFQVVAPDSGQLTVDIDAQSIGLPDAVDSYVAVYDESLNLVGSNDDENTNANLLDSFLTVDVTQGAKYFIAVTTFQNQAFSVTNPFDRHSINPNAVGSYQVYFSFDNGDQNGVVNRAVDFNAADADLNGQVQGVIGADQGVPLFSANQNGGNKDVDFFAFAPTQPGLLDVVAAGDSGFNPVVGLWQLDDQGQLVALGDTTDAPSTIGLEITDAMVGQPIYISVTGAGNQGFNPFAAGSGSGGATGTYTLSLTQRTQAEFASLTDNSIQDNTPESVNVGEPLRRDVGRDGTIDVGADDIDIYRFDSPFNGTLTVNTDTSDENSADTFLRVFDSQGQEIAFNNNASDTTTASSVSLQVAAGQTYYIGVNGASANARDYDALTGASAAAGSQGHYTLMLSASNTDVPLITVSDTAATETPGADATASFTVSLSQTSSVPVTVNYATADGSATAGSDFLASSGTLTFAPGKTSKTVPVTVLGDFDDEGAESFKLNLSGATASVLGNNSGTATIANTTPSVPPGDVAPGHPLTFTDADGSKVTLSIKGPGAAKVFFASDGSDAGRIELDGTTAGTTLTLKGSTSVHDLIVNGSLKSLGGKTLSLTGHVIVTGAVPKMTFNDVTGGATISIGSGQTTIAADQVQDLSVTSSDTIKSIKASQWLDTDATPDVISALFIGTITVKGAFQADVSAGSIGKMTVGGAVSGSNVRARQTIASVSVGSITDSLIFAGVDDNATTLPDALNDFAGGSAIGAFSVKSKAPGAFSDTLIAAETLGKLSLGTVATSNAGSTFGVAGDTVASVSGATDAAGKFKRSALGDAADSLTVGDFVLRLL
jgi:hypothetical protein